MTDEAMRRTAYHEAGHAVIGVALGVPIDGVSIRASSCYAGIALLRPAPVDTSVIDIEAPTPVLMPPKLRRALETRLWVSLAGDLAAEMAVRRSRYGEADTTDRVAAATIAVELTGRSKDALERAEAMTEIKTDWDSAIATADILAWREAVQYIAFATAATRRLLAECWPAVDAVAQALMSTPVLSGRQVKRIIRKPNQGDP